VTAEKSIQRHQGRWGDYKTALEGHAQGLRDARWGRRDPVSSPWTQPKKKVYWNPSEVYCARLLGAKVIG
jgi:hypothetical protein